MLSSTPFREGVRAAIPVWIAFTTSSFALGVAAKANGLHWGEIVLMSALVYAGPAQFAVVGPLGAGAPPLQVLLAGFLINLRFLPMSAALAPYFRRVARGKLIAASHFISASSFIIPYIRFQRESQKPRAKEAGNDESNLQFFLGLSMTSFSVWVMGTGAGYWAALHVPAELEEAIKFVLPGYFACLLATEAREWSIRAVCIASMLIAVPGALWNPNWGWIVTALVIATLGWGVQQWMRRE
jgi:predicted branched-subunit amino acid permease